MSAPQPFPLRQRVRSTLDQLRAELLRHRTPDGFWVGCLAPSALSTATAVSALAATLLHRRPAPNTRCTSTNGDPPASPAVQLLGDTVRRGMDYLQCHQKDDGGFGDTDRSHSNIATSYLVLAASQLATQSIGVGLGDRRQQALRRYINQTGEERALKARYGTDKTFVVPILTNLAIAGLVDWKRVPALPFEAAVFPQSMYRLLRMPVVSYAIPALVAIGQARHFLGPRSWMPLRLIRRLSVNRTMRVLERMQPQSGGYLEATPLTSFVVMSLAATGRSDSPVAQRGLGFLIDSMNPDGSWPIDTDLATWVTSLAMQAMAADPDDDGSWYSERLITWHLSCQHREQHPFTGAEPGGWGWSDFSGAVPDSDDTPAAMLALGAAAPIAGRSLRSPIDEAINGGATWLRRLQNRDGGWPTFCRGWGKLPFDRSSTDLTAHAIRALHNLPVPDHNLPVHDPAQTAPTRHRGDRAIRSGVAFLRKNQNSDGSWFPLWFGNQDELEETNAVYGTARVLLAGPQLLGRDSVLRGVEFLLGRQNSDGGWGGGESVTAWLRKNGPALRGNNRSGSESERSPSEGFETIPERVSTVEETALAVEALSQNLLDFRRFNREAARASPGNSSNFGKSHGGAGNESCRAAIIRGVEFLLQAVSERRHEVPWPIGFYFAKLWYHEQLYPLVFTTAALGRYLSLAKDDSRSARRSRARRQDGRLDTGPP